MATLVHHDAMPSATNSDSLERQPLLDSIIAHETYGSAQHDSEDILGENLHSMVDVCTQDTHPADSTPR